jgi:DNA-binding response OmpR family regulator
VSGRDSGMQLADGKDMPDEPVSRIRSNIPKGLAGTVLLADDDRSLRSLLAAVLRQEGYDVIGVGTGIEVLNHVEGSLRHPAAYPRVDVLVTDIHMPGLSGLDAMASLAAARCLPRTIVMTGAGSWEERDRAVALGAVAVLCKPFAMDTLRAAVSNQFGRVA